MCACPCPSPCELAVSVSALASAIASRLSDDELALLAAVLVQLGDTLATIAVQREVCAKCNDKAT